MPKIFISYRRDDGDFQAHTLCKLLRQAFGSESVFIDVDTIPPGVDFRQHLRQSVSQCDVLLAVISDRWLDIRSEDGHRRLDDPRDFVRIEIEQALARDIPVAPLVFGQARMPQESDLPEALRDLAYRNAVFVRSGRDFDAEAERLIQWLQPSAKPVTTTEPTPAQLQAEGEQKLAEVVREALERSRGKLTQNDTARANEIRKQHGISGQRAQRIVDDLVRQWREARPARTEPTPGEIITNSLGMKLAWIPPGIFLMGSPANENGRSDNDKQHQVTLSKGYYLGVGPVSRGQFARFVQDACYETQAEAEGGAYSWTGKERKWDPAFNWRMPGFEQTDEHPVVCTSWNDAVAFCQWLSKREKQPYRLPREAEWEYACRAGTTTAYYFGSTISANMANFNRKIDETTPIGRFPANAWGLCDMHGNVWEWCADWFGEYPTGTVVDPQGPANGERRVLRGGSFHSLSSFVRSASRTDGLPADRFTYCGFRAARSYP